MQPVLSATAKLALASDPIKPLDRLSAKLNDVKDRVIFLAHEIKQLRIQIQRKSEGATQNQSKQNQISLSTPMSQQSVDPVVTLQARLNALMGEQEDKLQEVEDLEAQQEKLIQKLIEDFFIRRSPLSLPRSEEIKEKMRQEMIGLYQTYQVAYEKKLLDMIQARTSNDGGAVTEEDLKDLNRLQEDLNSFLERSQPLLNDLAQKIVNVLKEEKGADSEKVLHNIESIMETGPHLLAKILAKVAKEVPGELLCAFLIGRLSQEALKRLVECCMQIEILQECTKVLKNGSAFTLFREDTIFTKIPCEYLRTMCTPFLTPSVQLVIAAMQTRHPVTLQTPEKLRDLIRVALQILKEGALQVKWPEDILEMCESMFKQLEKYLPREGRSFFVNILFLRLICPMLRNHPEKDVEEEKKLLPICLQQLANRWPFEKLELQF